MDPLPDCSLQTFATIALVGDSRLCLWRENELKTLTRDDNWLIETWVRRAFTEDQLQKIPLKNVLSKAIGSKEDMEFPIQELQLVDGDTVLLCSDGLHGLITDDQTGIFAFGATGPERTVKPLNLSGK